MSHNQRLTEKTITYQHNALHQRVAKLVDGMVTEKYLWADLTTLLAVYDAEDNLVQRFEYADSRMLLISQEMTRCERNIWKGDATLPPLHSLLSILKHIIEYLI